MRAVYYTGGNYDLVISHEREIRDSSQLHCRTPSKRKTTNCEICKKKRSYNYKGKLSFLWS